jgi:Na+-driven multidrug efflux pump
MCIRFFNYISLAGVFRGSCDTRWVMFLELTTVWVIAVPLAFLGAYVFKLEIHHMLLLVMIEELVKAAFIIPRMKSKKWLKPIQLS